MDKNTLLGLLLMGAVLFGFMYINRNDQLKQQQARQEQAEQQQKAAEEAAARALVVDTITSAEAANVAGLIRQAGVADTADASSYRFANANVDLRLGADGTVSGTVKGVDTVMPYERVVASDFGTLSLDNRKALTSNLRSALDAANRFRSFARYLTGEEQMVTLENDVVRVDLSSHGGMIARSTLLHYDTYISPDGDPHRADTALVEICRPADASYSFILTTASQRFDTADFFFTPQQLNDSTVLMTLNLEGGATWGLRYTLPKGSYVMRMDVVQNDMERIIPPSVASADFVWKQKMGRNERGRTFEERNSGIYYKYIGDSPSELGGVGNKQKQLDQRLKWIAFKNQFFSMVMIPTTSFNSAELNSVDLKGNPDFVKDLSARATLDYNSTEACPVSIDVFMGPNLYPLLSKVSKELGPDDGLDLTNLLPLGWPIFRWINTLIIIPVFTFLSHYISNYGIIILLLTLFIKIILFPLTYKSFMSQAKMRLLAPEIKEINDKYPGQENAMTRNQKTMALYSRAGASPFSGCLPMMLQMPILIAMFWFFPSCIELRGEQFLWAKDLAAPDVIFTLPFTIPWYGNHVSLFCLLMTATNIIYTQLNMQNQPSSSQMPGMKWMMYLMPLMFLFFFNDYAAGLSYYYFLSLLITIAMTYAFRFCLNEEKVRQKMKENAAKPKKKSGFMARLEEAQRRQQAMLKEQQKRRK